MKPTQDMINYAIDDFDAHKVSRMMDAVGWRWSSVPEDRAPDAFEIRQCCRHLCDCLVSDGRPWISTGGIVAKFNAGEDDDGPFSILELEFVGVSSEANE